MLLVVLVSPGGFVREKWTGLLTRLIFTTGMYSLVCHSPAVASFNSLTGFLRVLAPESLCAVAGLSRGMPLQALLQAPEAGRAAGLLRLLLRLEIPEQASDHLAIPF